MVQPARSDIPNKFNFWQKLYNIDMEPSFDPFLSPQGTTEIRTHEWTNLKVLDGLSLKYCFGPLLHNWLEQVDQEAWVALGGVLNYSISK